MAFKEILLIAGLFVGCCSSTGALIAAEIVVDDVLINKVAQKYGDFAGRRMAAWKKIIENYADLPELQKLQLVNNFFNQLEFETDMLKWGRADYWATPVEFIALNGGDCEDFAVAKYFTLLALGVDSSKLQLTYVKALSLNQAHMVLTYYATVDAEPLVLDNLVKEILPGSKRGDLLPLYSFNADGLWQAKSQGVARRRLGESSKIKNWQDLNERMLKGL